MCFCFTTRRKCHFSFEKTVRPPKWVVRFVLEKRHIPKTNHGNRQGFYRKKLQHQRQTHEIVEDFAWKYSKVSFFHFLFFLTCFPFWYCFHFFLLSSSIFPFSFSTIFSIFQIFNFSVIHFFAFFSFFLFLFFSFFSRPSRRQNRKNRREGRIVKMTFFFCEELIFEPRWTGERGGREGVSFGKAHLRVTPLSCFSFLFFCFLFEISVL